MIGPRTTLAALVVFGSVAAGRPASAQQPAALVEQITTSRLGIQAMDYVADGRVLELAEGEVVVLGYLRSCWQERIEGGTVTIGAERSEVVAGRVTRRKVECSGGRMQLSAQKAGRSGAAVFRGGASRQVGTGPLR